MIAWCIPLVEQRPDSSGTRPATLLPFGSRPVTQPLNPTDSSPYAPVEHILFQMPETGKNNGLEM